MERVGTGHAKLLLFGEHAAVYGFPSLGLGLPYSTTITVVARDAEGWRFPDLPETDLKRFGAFIASASKFIPALAGGGGENPRIVDYSARARLRLLRGSLRRSGRSLRGT